MANLKWIAIAFGIFFGMRFYHQTAHGAGYRISNGAFQSISSNDPCSGKTTCVSVYIAPWCPSCRAATPYIKRLRNDGLTSKKIGVRIFVGADRDKSKLEAKAVEMGQNAFIDPDGQIMAALQVTSFPTFVVSDSTGAIVQVLKHSYNSQDPNAAYGAILRDLGIQF